MLAYWCFLRFLCLHANLGHFTSVALRTFWRILLQWFEGWGFWEASTSDPEGKVQMWSVGSAATTSTSNRVIDAFWVFYAWQSLGHFFTFSVIFLIFFAVFSLFSQWSISSSRGTSDTRHTVHPKIKSLSTTDSNVSHILVESGQRLCWS